MYIYWWDEESKTGIKLVEGIERHLNDTFGMVSSVLCVWDFLRLNMIDATTAEVVTFVMHTFHLLILFSPCYFAEFLKFPN